MLKIPSLQNLNISVTSKQELYDEKNHENKMAGILSIAEDQVRHNNTNK